VRGRWLGARSRRQGVMSGRRRAAKRRERATRRRLRMPRRELGVTSGRQGAGWRSLGATRRRLRMPRRRLGVQRLYCRFTETSSRSRETLCPSAESINRSTQTSCRSAEASCPSREPSNRSSSTSNPSTRTSCRNSETSCRCVKPGRSLQRAVVSVLRENGFEHRDVVCLNGAARSSKRGDVSELRAVVLLHGKGGKVLPATCRLWRAVVLLRRAARLVCVDDGGVLRQSVPWHRDALEGRAPGASCAARAGAVEAGRSACRSMLPMFSITR